MDYEKLKLKEYSKWDLYLHEAQNPYIGRSYAWAKNPNSDHLREMSKDQRNELFDAIIPEWEKAIYEVTGPARTNLAIFGNLAPHLHAHLIPRHALPIPFNGREYIDPNPKGNYAPYLKIDLSEKELFEIRDFMIEHL